MKNPWKELSANNTFVLKSDASELEKLNKNKDKIQTHVPPEPFAGKIDAPVVFLLRNPLYTAEGDDKYMLENEDFIRDMKAVREQEQKVVDIEYSIYHLNKKYPANPGYVYWHRKMKELIQATSLERCAQKILFLQLFPYKTNNTNIKKSLQSFCFTRFLLNNALDRNALVIQLYGKNDWEKACPNLMNYTHRYYAKSYRAGTISRGNLGKECFDRLVTIIS